MEKDKKLQNYLQNKNLFFDLNNILILQSALEQHVPVLLRGLPGVGKTELTRVISEFLNAKYCFMQCFPGCSEEDLIYKVLPSEQTVSGIKLIEGIIPEALTLSQSERVVLVLDEWDKTRPSADAFLLDLLQNLRLTVRFDGVKELRGNPQNLWVFLTSNDEREFSEPLQRRCVLLNLKPLSPENVKKILEKEGFKKELSLLLTQLYVDTFDAGLSKPATIQELKQLGRAVSILGDGADWTNLVHSYVVKSDEDWRIFRDYVSRRPQSYHNFFEDAETENDISEYYDSEIEEKKEGGAEKEQSAPKARMPKVVIHQHKENIEPISPVSVPIETSMVLPFNEDNYSQVIKDLRPEPSDDPCSFEDIRVIKDEDRNIITKLQPFTLKQIITKMRFWDTDAPKLDVDIIGIIASGGEFFVCDKLLFTEKGIKKLIQRFQIIYYTRDFLRFKKQEKDEFDFVLKRLRKVSPLVSEWEIELIISKKTSGEETVKEFLRKLLNASAQVEAGYEMWKQCNGYFDKNSYVVEGVQYSSSAVAKYREDSVQMTEDFSSVEVIRKQLEEHYGFNVFPINRIQRYILYRETSEDKYSRTYAELDIAELPPSTIIEVGTNEN